MMDRETRRFDAQAPTGVSGDAAAKRSVSPPPRGLALRRLRAGAAISALTVGAATVAAVAAEIPLDGGDRTLLSPAVLAAALAGALAVASSLAAATFWRRAQAAVSGRDRLAAMMSNDLSIERVYELASGRLSAASPATEAFVRSVAPSPGPNGRASAAEALRAELGAESFDQLKPHLRALAATGAPFEITLPAAAGRPRRLIGQTRGARAILRLSPTISDAGAPEAEPSQRDDPTKALEDAARTAQTAQAAAEAQASTLAAALSAARAGVATFDAEGRLRFANAEIRRLWDLDPEWIAEAPSLRALLDALRDGGRIPERRDFAEWRSEVVADPVTAFPGDELFFLTSGEALRIAAAPSPDGGLVLHVTDESPALALERRINEAVNANRAALTAIDHGLAIVDAAGKVSVANPAFRRLWGLDEALWADGAAPSLRAVAEIAAQEAADPEVDVEVWRRIEESVGGALSPRRTHLFEAPRSFGRALRIRVTPLPDGGALVDCAQHEADAVETAPPADIPQEAPAPAPADIAAWEQDVATGLDAPRSDMSEADMIEADVLEAAGEEMRRPLNAVIGFADMLRGGVAGELSERQAAHVDDVLTAAHDLRALVAEMTELSELRAGRAPVRSVQFDPSNVVAGAGRRLENALRGRGLEVSVDAPDDLAAGPAWSGDPVLLRRAVEKFGEELAKSAEPGDRLHIDLFADAEAAKIAVALVRAVEDGDAGAGGDEPPLDENWLIGAIDAAATSPGDDLGLERDLWRRGALGVALARAILSRHGAAVELRDGPAGPTAQILLPRGGAAAAPDVDARAFEPRLDPRVHPGGEGRLIDTRVPQVDGAGGAAVAARARQEPEAKPEAEPEPEAEPGAALQALLRADMSRQ